MFEMTNERTEYVEKLMKFVIGEEVKVERTKGQKDKTPVLGTGHLADGKGATVKEGKREYASGNISKSVKRDLDELDALMEKYKNKFDPDFLKEYNKLMDRMKATPHWPHPATARPERWPESPIERKRRQASMPDPKTIQED